MSAQELALPVFDKTGTEIGKTPMDPAIFAVTASRQVIHDAVLTYLADMRQDTARTKKRKDVRGGGKKPYRQKGTGRARAGSSRSPLWVGGGTVFGPTGVQNHRISQNKKAHRLALRAAWSELVRDGRLVVIDDFALDPVRTKTAVSLLTALKMKGEKILAVLAEDDSSDAFVKASRNLPNVFLAGPTNVSVYDLLNVDKVLTDRKALSMIGEALK